MIVENGEELVYRAVMPARHFNRRFSLCYALMMIGAGLQLPFLPLWLGSKQMTAKEIGIIMAVYAGCRMVSVPATSMIADRLRNRRSMIIAFAALSVLGFGLLSQANGFYQILLCIMLAASFTAPVFPLAESFSSEGSAALGVDYGRIRLWASLSFLVGNVGGGLLLLKLPTSSVIYLIVVAQMISAAALWLLPPDPLARSTTRVFHDRFSGGLKLLINRPFGLFLLTVSLGQSSHAMIYAFGSLKWTSAGFSALNIGMLWAVAVLSEVLFLFLSRPVVARIGAFNLMAVGISGGVLRWFLMVPDLGLVFSMAVQCLHALSFAALHLGTMHYLVQNVPRSSRNLAQGIYSATSGGLAMMVMTWIAGMIYSRLGGEGYFVMAGLSLAALAFALALRRINPTAPGAAAP